MDKQARRQLTKELALEAGYRVIRFTTGSEFLHYGRFEPDIPPDFVHLKAAQDRYLDRLIELIPAGVRTILDVGAGSGRTAEVLMDRGFAVDCVSPPGALAAIVDQHLSGRGMVYRALLEEAVIPARYDLVLFSESFQYIPMKQALDKAIAVLNPSGYILISDFFNRGAPGGTPFRGGHPFAAWRDLHAQYPLTLVRDDDITKETALVHDILAEANRDVLIPILENARTAAAARWPFLTRTFLRLFGRRIEKALGRRLSKDRTGAEFMRAKIYKVYLFHVASGGK